MIVLKTGFNIFYNLVLFRGDALVCFLLCFVLFCFRETADEKKGKQRRAARSKGNFDFALSLWELLADRHQGRSVIMYCTNIRYVCCCCFRNGKGGFGQKQRKHHS